MLFLTSAEIAPVETSRIVVNLNSYSNNKVIKRLRREYKKNSELSTSVKVVVFPLEGFAKLLISTRTCPAGNSFPKKSFVTLAKSLNLAVKKVK